MQVPTKVHNAVRTPSWSLMPEGWSLVRGRTGPLRGRPKTNGGPGGIRPSSSLSERASTNPICRAFASDVCRERTWCALSKRHERVGRAFGRLRGDVLLEDALDGRAR